MTTVDQSTLAKDALRAHQEQDPTLGPLFSALHTFADRTIAEFYGDAPGMPSPVIAFEKDRLNRRGYYKQMDGYLFPHRINLNPFAIAGGTEAAEVLAHELVHLWQAHVGRPCTKEVHGKEFHQRMRLYGISTYGKRGTHIGPIENDTTWSDWMQVNSDLGLERFVLPGADKKKPRQLIKHQCLSCNATFRSRKPLSAMCMDCDEPFEIVN